MNDWIFLVLLYASMVSLGIILTEDHKSQRKGSFAVIMTLAICSDVLEIITITTRTKESFALCATLFSVIHVAFICFFCKYSKNIWVSLCAYKFPIIAIVANHFCRKR